MKSNDFFYLILNKIQINNIKNKNNEYYRKNSR